MRTDLNGFGGSSRWGWALLLLAVITAVFLRFWQLGEMPPGLYHDEAYNGLDAASVLVEGPSLFFEANNGREPAYILLTSLAVAALGQTTLAVRLMAAIVGSLTVIAVYLLADCWFGRKVGLLSAWMWAITLWPVHLSRIGLRSITMVPLMALAFWLGTLAFRKQKVWLWFLSGLVYGLSYYTYLAIRFTPLLLLLLLLFLLWRDERKRLWPGVGWFVLGAGIILLPLALMFFQQPDMLLGRTGQVSILNPEINGGDLFGTLLKQIGLALGMFFWRGDNILRHNPVGRPVFDVLMLAPFLIGLAWSIVHWKRPQALAILLWVGVMLWPTILAEDTPHFLRSVGVLPAAIIFPAIGLAWIWDWARLPIWLRKGVVGLLIVGSLFITVRDYVNYSRQPDVAYLFETAVTDLAESVNAQKEGTAVYLDEERFWQKYSTLRYLIPKEKVIVYRPDELVDINKGAVIYSYPYISQSFVKEFLSSPALVAVEVGSLARGDLETQAVPLYLQYSVMDAPDLRKMATFGGYVDLYQVDMAQTDEGSLLVDLVWEITPENYELINSGNSVLVVHPSTISTVFVHVVGPNGLIAQSDSPPANGFMQPEWWQPGLFLRDRHEIAVPDDFDIDDYQLHIGWYDSLTQTRAHVLDTDGELLGDAFIWPNHGTSE